MKINCTSPYHDDAVASMQLYEDSGFCFACNYRDYDVADKDLVKPEPDNIPENISKINNLPKKLIRGLELPYNNNGYYIVWPDLSFYKRRNWQGEPKYQGPRGHKPPLLIYPSKNTKTLILVEGELNAMSLHSAIGDICTIASPGSAGNFHESIDYACTFYTIVCILDRDPAGVSAGVSFKKEALRRGKRVELVCVDRDYNGVFEESGKEGLQQAFAQDLGLRQRMQA